jgi:hypothetical protein
MNKTERTKIAHTKLVKIFIRSGFAFGTGSERFGNRSVGQNTVFVYT